MKTISIIQPWATLIMLGEKKYETRSWQREHRGELLIHSSKKIDKRHASRNHSNQFSLNMVTLLRTYQ